MTYHIEAPQNENVPAAFQRVTRMLFVLGVALTANVMLLGGSVMADPKADSTNRRSNGTAYAPANGSSVAPANNSAPKFRGGPDRLRGRDPDSPGARSAPDQPTEAQKEAEEIRQRLTYRYANPVVARFLRTLSPNDAVKLYREASQLIDSRHLDPVGYQSRVNRALRSLTTGVSNPEFQRANGIRLTEAQAHAFTESVKRLSVSRPVRSLNDTLNLMWWTMDLAKKQIGLNSGAVALEFVYGATDALDKYSAFEPNDTPRKPSAALEDHVVGIGVEIKPHDSGVLVVKPLRGGPAAAAGLKPNDIIVSVNGKPLAGKKMDYAVDLIAGPEGSRVMLGVQRDGNKLSPISLVRRRVTIYSVSEIRMVSENSKVGYIKLDKFMESSSEEFDQALWELHRKGMQSLVVDLRGNPGGLLTTAISLSNKFLPRGTIVSTRGRNQQDNSVEYATYEQTWKVPLVVLVDENSASASEIFAAAIQENGRGLVVGTKSYGKGTVQTHFPLQSVSGNLRLTTAKFYSPRGRVMAGSGVTPDFEVKTDAKSAGQDAVLQKAVEVADGKTAREMADAQGGKILAVGPAKTTAIPANAKIVDVRGKVIIPGLVDTHSHIGVYSRPGVRANSDGNEMTGPVQAIVRALDSLNPFDPGIKMATAGGVTTANIMPGSGNVIGGQTIYVKLRGYTPEQMWIASPDVLGGLKMANGENPKRSYGGKGQAPGTRMKVAALQRSEFIKAQNYMRKWNRYRKQLAAGEKVSAPDVDISLEPLVEVLQKKRTVHFHTHRADDILTVLRLKKEFGFELVIQHGTEAYKVLDEIAKHKVSVSMTVVDSPGGKAEVVDFIEQCGAELHKRGIRVLINTDDPVTESRFFLRTTAIPVRGGLPEDAALKAITLRAAEAMHLDHRIGSLAAGKDADFVVLSGKPFSVYTRVLQTYIDGKKVFDLRDPKQRLYQTGGFGVADRSMLPKTPAFVKPLPAVRKPSAPKKAAAVKGDEREMVILAGRLHTVSNGTIKNGVVHVRDGKIVYAGARRGFEFPKNVPVLTAAVVTPGLIDAHSQVPLSGQYNIPADQDADETSDPNQADVRTLDAFNPSEPLLRFLLTQGVTVIHASPGRANVIGGMTGVYRTHGQSAEAMTIRFPHAMLFNLGESPKRTYSGRKPATRMGTVSLIRGALTEANNYARKRAAAKKDEPVDRELKQEALANVTGRKMRALFCAQRADDILTALRLIREFKLDGQIALAADAYLIRDRIAKTGVPIIVHPTMQRAGSRIETYNSYLGNAAALADSKITVAIASGVEGYVPKTRVIRHEAAIAAVYGLGIERALKAITLDAAKILGIDEQYGSLEKGKVGDLVLYDGDPFEHKTHVTHVIVGGKVVVDRSKKKQIPLAQRIYYASPWIPCCLGW
eukprot:g21962.t1